MAEGITQYGTRHQRTSTNDFLTSADWIEFIPSGVTGKTETPNRNYSVSNYLKSLKSQIDLINPEYVSNLGTAGVKDTHYVTATDVIAMNNWYKATTDSSTNGVIDKWFEIKNFVSGFTTATDLASFLANNYVAKSGGTMTGALTVPTLNVTGNASFTQLINGNIAGNSGTTTKLQTPVNITVGNSTLSFDGTLNLNFTAANIGLGNYITSTVFNANQYSYAHWINGDNTGALCKTNVIASNKEDKIVVHIYGMGYGYGLPINTYAQVYNHSTGLINASATHFGAFSGDIKFIRGADDLIYIWVQFGNHSTQYNLGAKMIYIKAVKELSTSNIITNVSATTVPSNATLVVTATNRYGVVDSVLNNAATATKLKTAVNITVGNETKSFDGSEAISFAGGGTSDGTTVQTVTRATNADHYITFVDSDNATAALESVYTDAGLKYNPYSNILTANIKYNDETVANALNDIIAKVFPLAVETDSRSGDGTYEMGKSTTLSVTMGVKNRSTIPAASVTWAYSTDNSTYTTFTATSGNTVTRSLAANTDGSGLLRIKATYGGVTVYSTNRSFSHSYYRYRAMIPISITTGADLLTHLNDTNTDLYKSKALSTDTAYSTKVNIPQNKNYAIVVKASRAPVPNNNLGPLSGYPTGTISVPRRDTSGTSDTMFYTIVPGSTSGVVSNIYFS